MRLLYLLCFFVVFSGLRHDALAQAVSNEGTDFYAVFPTHMPAGETRNGVVISTFPAEYSIFITGKSASSGTVTVGNSVQRFNLTQANSVVEVRIPRAQAYIAINEANRVLSNRAIRVQVDPGKPKVVVYGHIFAGRRSAASLILPREALGQTYYSMNYEVGQTSDGGDNHIVIAAADPDTRIFIQRNGQDVVPGGILLNNAGDVYELLSKADMTGTKIFVDPVTSACKRFAVFSGTTNSGITLAGGCSTPSSDPLYQQNYPVESWGETYGFVPFSMLSRTGENVRTRGNFVRVLAKEDGTEVRYNGNVVATLAAGKYYQATTPAAEPILISANKPVAVAQYALTQSCAGGGVSDPDMVILNPIEYNIRNITVYSSSKEAIREQYVNILIKTSAASTFKVNGVVPTQPFLPLKAAPEYSYLQLNLNQYSAGTFNLSASEGFNAIAYGFGDVESYAYSAGTNLASSQFAQAERPDSKETITDACAREPFNIKVSLTSPALSLSWQFEENAAPEVQNIPPGASVPVVRNGTTYYDYYFPRQVAYQSAGTKTIRVTATYPSIAGCALGQQQIDLSFSVYESPVAKFKVPSLLCTGSAIQFTDESDNSGSEITSWLWDFGDNQFSDEQNPSHIYASAGTYTVRLVVANASSCAAGVIEHTIVVAESARAEFSSSTPECDDPTIRFTDQSKSGASPIAKWIWDFGDGSPIVENSSGAPVSHTYTRNGVFTASLTVEVAGGCTHTYSSSVNINIPFLELGADITILRGGSYQLKPQISGNGLTYKWSPSTGLDRDDIPNPVTTLNSDEQYTLTIRSPEGCVVTDDIRIRVVDAPIIRNTFTPNGDGVNDVWTIDYLESYPESSVNIYNRFGVRVFTSIGYSKPWNGMFNGVPVPVGTYYYVIDPKMGLPVYTGSVTVIR